MCGCVPRAARQPRARADAILVTARASRRAGPGRSATALYAKLVLVALFWGGTYVAGRAVAQQLPNFTTGALRFALATAILVALAYAHEGGLPKLDRHRFAAMLALALTGVFFFNACFFAALERIPASRGALIMSLNPVAIAIGARLVFREKSRATRALGIALALCGAVIVVTHGDLTTAAGAFGAGEWLMLGSVLGWTSYTLIGRVVLRGMSPLGASAWAAL